MAKRQIVQGSTDVTIDVFIQDSSVTTGAGKTGLAYNTGSLVCYYREGATDTAHALSLVTQTVGGAHTDGGFVEIDATNMPGLYRLDLSDTIVSGTNPYVIVMLKGAANMAPCVVEIELVKVDMFDNVRAGLTALPNAAAAATGGLFVRGTGAGAINQATNGMIDVNLVRIADAAVSTSTAQLGVNAVQAGGTAWESGAVTAGSIATGAITNAKFAAGAIDAAAIATNAIDADAVATDAVTEIQSGLATSAQIGQIQGSGGAALSFDSSASNVTGALKSVTFVGTQSSGTYASTSNLNGTFHVITDTANAFDVVYKIPTGTSLTAISGNWDGYLTSANDTATIQMYNFVGAAWETVATITGTAGTTVQNKTWPMYSRNTGAGADIGDTYIRIVTTGMTTPTLGTDRLYVNATLSQSSIGYDLSRIWCNTTSGTSTGTTFGQDGTVRNRCNSISNAITIARAAGYDHIDLANGTSSTLASSGAGLAFIGENASFAFGGQNISDAAFYGLSLSGTGTCATGEAYLQDCEIGTVTIGNFDAHNCGVGATLTLSQTGDYQLINCYSQVAGSSSPVIDMGSGVGAQTMSVRGWRGGLTLNNLASGDVVTLDGTFGTITLNGADATVEIRGTYKALTNNLTGSPTVGVVGAIKGQDVADALANTSTLTSRLTSARAGYLDNINNAALSTTSAQTGDAYARLGAPAGASVAADIATTNGRLTSTRAGYLDNLSAGAAALEATAQSVKTKTDSLTFTVSGKVDSNLTNIGSNTTAPAKLAAASDGIVQVTFATGTLSTTQGTTTLTETTADHYVGKTITWTSGALLGQSSTISAYNGTTKMLTWAATTDAPANNDTAVLS